MASFELVLLRGDGVALNIAADGLLGSAYIGSGRFFYSNYKKKKRKISKNFQTKLFVNEKLFTKTVIFNTKEKFWLVNFDFWNNNKLV